MDRLLVFEDGSVAGCDSSQWWVLSPDGTSAQVPELVEFRNSFAARPATSAGPRSHGLRGPENARWRSAVGVKVALWSSAWFGVDLLGRLGMLVYDVDDRRVKTYRPLEAWAADELFGPVLRGGTAPLPTPHPREPWTVKDDYARILDGGYPKPCVVEWRRGAGIVFVCGHAVEARPCDVEGLLYCTRALVADGVCRSLVARLDGTVASKIATVEDVRTWPQWRDVPADFFELVDSFMAQRLSPHGAWWQWWWPSVASNRRRVAKSIPGATLTYETGHTRARFDDGLVLVVDEADKAIALVPGRPDLCFDVDAPPADHAARVMLLLHFRRWAEPEDRIKFQLQRDQARQRVQTAVQASRRFVKTLDATLLRGAPSVLDARSRQADRLFYKSRHKWPLPPVK